MESYFDKSQRVKRDIENNQELKDKIEGALDQKTIMKSFNLGGIIDFYRVGRLKSGIYVVARVFKKNSKEAKLDLEKKLRLMESYCSFMQDLYLTEVHLGGRITDFCIGVKSSKNAGVLTEDLTSNGEYTLIHKQEGLEVAFGKRHFTKIKIFLDDTTGELLKEYKGELKYFSKEATLRL